MQRIVRAGRNVGDVWPAVLPTSALLACVILSAAAAEMQAAAPKPTTLYECGFELDDDQDYDLWPDGWTRRRGPGFPVYLSVSIAEEPSSEGNRCLRMDLNGGGVAIFSPPVAVGPEYSVVVTAQVKTDQLVYDHAHISLTFLDSERQPIESFDSPPMQTAGRWSPVALGPYHAETRDVAYVVAGLHVEPSQRADLVGSACFDDVRIERLPQLELSIDAPHHVLRVGQPIEVVCRASGLDVGDAQATLTLEDSQGTTVVRQQRRLELDAQRGDAAQRAEQVARDAYAPRASTTRWQLPAIEPGFYRLRFGFEGGGASGASAETTVAVFEPRTRIDAGEFGWSLMSDAGVVSLRDLGLMASDLGLNWVKLPLWTDETDQSRWDEIIRFVDQLNLRNVRVVGLLSEPPVALCRRLGLPDRPAAAALFQLDPAAWYSSLEPVLVRLALKVRSWQLTADDDVSMMLWRDTAARMAVVQHQLDRVGHGFNVGLAWDWLREVPRQSDPPWQFLVLQTDPPLTAVELGRYLEAVPSHPERWVSIAPLDEARYSREDRVADLVERLITAKRYGAAGIFATNPLDAASGFWTEAGTPGVLLVPWRTTATMLAGMRHIGSLALQSGSPNEVFATGDQAVAVVWSDRPRDEEFEMGDEIRQIDVWGRSQPPITETPRSFRVGKVPSFFTGIDPGVVAWHQSVRLAETRLPSVLGVPHRDSFTVKNGFDRGVTGTIRIKPLDDWRIEPSTFEVSLEAGEEIRRDFEVVFAATAQSGPRQVRFDFDVTSGRRYRFSVYRTLEVGLGDVWFDVRTRLTDDDDLEVAQRLVNETDVPVNFRCYLIVPGGRRIRAQVLDLGRGEQTLTYHLRDGRDLVGKNLWLLAEEVGGSRTLSHVIPVE